MSIKPSMYRLHTFKSWTLTHEIKNPHYNGKNLPELLVWTLSIWTPIFALMTLHVASPQNITLKFIHIFTMMLSIWRVLYHSYVLPKFIDIFIMMFSSWIVLYHSFVYGSMISPQARSYPKRTHFWKNCSCPFKNLRKCSSPYMKLRKCSNSYLNLRTCLSSVKVLLLPKHFLNHNDHGHHQKQED